MLGVYLGGANARIYPIRGSLNPLAADAGEPPYVGDVIIPAVVATPLQRRPCLLAQRALERCQTIVSFMERNLY